MPVRLGKDQKGCYARWGENGKKYHYTCGDTTSRNSAMRKANDQGKAIHANKGK